MENIQSVAEVAAANGRSAMYRVTFADGTVSFVPQAPENKDYAAIQAWLAAGNQMGQA